VAAVQYTFTHKQYTEYREWNIRNNKKKKIGKKKIWEKQIWDEKKLGGEIFGRKKIWRNKIYPHSIDLFVFRRVIKSAKSDY
jgi:hypothetical protein